MRLWAQVTYEIPDTLVDEVSAFLVELSPDGIVTENLTLDTFSLESVDDTPVKKVSAFFPADETLPEKLALVQSQLREFARFFPELVVKDPTVSYLKDEDWSSNWKVHFKPCRIGKRLVVKPTWEEFVADPGDIIVEVDPGMAFGTGTHATTKLCLEVIEKIFLHDSIYSAAPEVGAMLDVGTGSGILSIAAAKLGASRVTGIDIDEQAVAVARDNVTLNKVERIVDISETPLTQVGGTFDIVVANILAEELVRMAPQLLARINKAGYLIISGVLTEKEQIVMQGFSFRELAIVETSREAEWSCMTFRRSP